jgi:alanyl-tRNA synthetase
MDHDSCLTLFCEFFRERGHRVVPGSSLLTRPDDPVLFTSSGMHPLIPYLEGREHPSGRRLVDRQRCLRTTDLDEVGDPTHLTVFEMLGSWSLGDYDAPQSLRWGLDLLIEGFGIDSNRLHGTVFGGDDTVPPDRPGLEVWHEFGLPVTTTAASNWWSHGPVGLCGPDSEIFVWTGQNPPTGDPETDPRWVEVWNHVSIQYRRHDDGTLQPLEQQNVDTGMGFDRLLMLLQGKDSVYGTDLFRPWAETVLPLWDLQGQDGRVVCDHLRSSLVVLAEGVRPSNKGRGYVLRRLLRRVLTILWQQDPSRTLSDLPRPVLQHTLDRIGLPGRPEQFLGPMVEEERRFGRLLRQGRPVVRRLRSRGGLTESDYRFLTDTHGLPRELVDSPLLSCPDA